MYIYIYVYKPCFLPISLVSNCSIVLGLLFESQFFNSCPTAQGAPGQMSQSHPGLRAHRTWRIGHGYGMAMEQ